jgi:hypothetical protein
MGGQTPFLALEPADEHERLDGVHPFFLVYGVEAVIPSDLDFGTLRVHFYDEQRAKEQCQADIDMLEEVQNTTVVRSIGY